MATVSGTYVIDRPASRAAARVTRATVLLGVFGLAAAALVIVRLLESWRITSRATSHHVTILGERIGYPSANVDAIVILAIALLALVAILRGCRRAVAEGVASVRLGRAARRTIVGERNGVILVENERPLAFCLGLLRPRVYLSTAAAALFDARALDAVVAHERHHAARRDPLRFAAARVVADALFYLPGLRELVRRHEELAELSADESAVAPPGGRAALADAILALDDAAGGTVEPDRVLHLLGESPAWRFPLLACGAAAAVIILLAGVAVLAGRVATGSATLAPPFLSSQPCVLALAAIPGAVALAAAARRSVTARR